MSVILFHPKNSNKEIKKNGFNPILAYKKYKGLYILFLSLFTCSFLINVFLLLVLGHYLMMR